MKGKPIGGRGHKAKYDSTHARIPAPIKPLVESLADQYRAYVAEGSCLEFENKSLLPKIPAIYFVLEDEEIVYIGQTKNLVTRWRNHHITSNLVGLSGTVSIAWLQCDHTSLLKTIEAVLIANVKPRLNSLTEGKFTPKFVGEEKKLRSVRLTDTAWNKLHDIGNSLSVSRTDAIEHIARWGLRDERQIILAAIDRYIELERSRDRNGNQYGKEFRTDSPRWQKLNQFQKWVKDERF